MFRFDRPQYYTIAIRVAIIAVIILYVSIRDEYRATV